MLSTDDIIAGGSMIAVGLFGVLCHGLEFSSLWSLGKKFIGFRLVLGQSFAEVLLVIQFGIWGGLVCLTKNTIVPVKYKLYAHAYMDTMWFAMSYMQVAVALSRLICVIMPLKFRKFNKRYCYYVFGFVYSVSIIQAVIVHSFPWFVPLFYDPDAYGTTGDFVKYHGEGTGTYYFIIHLIIMGSYISIYLAVAVSICSKRKV